MLSLADPTIARDPPCAHLAPLPEGLPQESVCLDDWIRFSQKLWTDLFWPNAFDINRPLIFVDERLGAWAVPTRTTGQNSQGDHIEIVVGVPPEPADFLAMVVEGRIDLAQYQQILNSDAALADTIAILTNWESGWQVIMHSMLLSMRLENGEYMNLIIPYEEWDLKAADSRAGLGGCVVPICACAQWNLPDLSETEDTAYTQAVCERQAANARRIQDIEKAYSDCWWWDSVVPGGLSIIGGCLGIACPSGVSQVGGAIAVGAGATTVIHGTKSCKENYTNALNNLAQEFNQFVENRCFQACVASSQPPPPGP